MEARAPHRVLRLQMVRSVEYRRNRRITGGRRAQPSFAVTGSLCRSPRRFQKPHWDAAPRWWRLREAAWTPDHLMPGVGRAGMGSWAWSCVVVEHTASGRIRPSEAGHARHGLQRRSTLWVRNNGSRARSWPGRYMLGSRRLALSSGWPYPGSALVGHILNARRGKEAQEASSRRRAQRPHLPLSVAPYAAFYPGFKLRRGLQEGPQESFDPGDNLEERLAESQTPVVGLLRGLLPHDPDKAAVG